MTPRTTALAAAVILLAAAPAASGGGGAVTFIPAAKKDKGHFIGASVFRPGMDQGAQGAMPQAAPEYQPSEIPPSNVAAEPPPRIRATSIGDVRARRDPPVGRQAGTIVLEPVKMAGDGGFAPPAPLAPPDGEECPQEAPEGADDSQEAGGPHRPANPLARLAITAESVRNQQEETQP